MIAEAIHKACKGIGTNERAVIYIVVHRSKKELREVAKAYKTLYDKDIVEVLDSETSGWFRKALLYLFKTALAEPTRMHLPEKMLSRHADIS